MVGVEVSVHRSLLPIAREPKRPASMKQSSRRRKTTNCYSTPEYDVWLTTPYSLFFQDTLQLFMHVLRPLQQGSQEGTLHESTMHHRALHEECRRASELEERSCRIIFKPLYTCFSHKSFNTNLRKKTNEGLQFNYRPPRCHHTMCLW
jgi:hypothetical protein